MGGEYEKTLWKTLSLFRNSTACPTTTARMRGMNFCPRWSRRTEGMGSSPAWPTSETYAIPYVVSDGATEGELPAAALSCPT